MVGIYTTNQKYIYPGGLTYLCDGYDLMNQFSFGWPSTTRKYRLLLLVAVVVQNAKIISRRPRHPKRKKDAYEALLFRDPSGRFYSSGSHRPSMTFPTPWSGWINIPYLLSVTVIAVINGIGNPSSNSGRGFFFFLRWILLANAFFLGGGTWINIFYLSSHTYG